MRIQEYRDIHFVIPHSYQEDLIAQKTLDCVEEGKFWTDSGDQEKWENFLFLYDRLVLKRGRNDRTLSI